MPLSPQAYNNDGSGRDSYVSYNSGGLNRESPRAPDHSIFRKADAKSFKPKGLGSKQCVLKSTESHIRMMWSRGFVLYLAQLLACRTCAMSGSLRLWIFEPCPSTTRN